MKTRLNLKGILLLFVSTGLVCCYDDGSVLLRDIQALTLYRDRHTTARRSSPIPQLKCVGGSAGCHSYTFDVVQCVNKGWDGVDVQWECRTDMDSAYRFGRVEVSCEGYNHPTDAYVLKGSCGLEYTLELTAEGRRASQGGWGSRSGFKDFEDLGDFASGFFSGFSGNGGGKHHQQQPPRQSSYPDGSGVTLTLLGLPLVLLLAYAVYRLLSGNAAQPDGGAAGHHRPGPQGDSAGPPPPGFKPDFTGYSEGHPSDSFDQQQSPGGWAQGAPRNTGGGFWTGMGTGGVLGYLFGRQSNQPYNYNYPSNNYGFPSNNYGFPSNSYKYPSHSYRSSPPSPPSSGTRTASGFGGTKRR